ncbi:hypothetical protein ILUMI_16095 [Ignelater luminosus]|uniref:Uncharacterized protein n=1 Tax=Ignelater luminosus TaxID=2038154 RepID=A0A8K0CTJ6_IGNLU|nr:hypothetical protein ILUMI_16095 [Ignelater luminosus]
MMQPVDSLCRAILGNHKKRCRGSNRKTRTTEEERMLEEPTLSEIRSCIQKLKNNEAPGIDNIPTELIILEGTKQTEQIHQVTLKIWGEVYMPDE